MNINTIALDQPAGPKASNAPRGGNGGSGSFQVAYARVLGDNYVPLARHVVTAHPSRGQDSLPPADGAAHTVRAGETLYGIVRARLAAMGVQANAKALMQGVKQLAQANNIHNPDRIYVGQKLDLAQLESSFGQPAALPSGGIEGSTNAARGIDQPQPWHWEEPMPEAGAQTTVEVEAALPSTIDTLPPTIARDDAAVPVPVPVPVPAQVPAQVPVPVPVPAQVVADAGDRTPLAVRQVALYAQDTSIAPAKPAEAGRALPDIIYKGVVGKVLDAMPLEPSTRTGLQQANALVSSTVSAHALGVLTGFGGPLLTVAGLIWGIFSARQIDAAATRESKMVDAPTPAGDLKFAGDVMQAAQNKPLAARN